MLKDEALTLISIQDRSYASAGSGILHSYPKDHAMDAEQFAVFLDSKKHAVFATSRPDGRPQAAPIAFTVWKGAFWVASAKGARLRNLRNRPYASMVVIEGEEKTHRAVIVEGPVHLHPVHEINTSQNELAEL